MDEEISIIDSKTRNEKIKNFLLKNKILIICIVAGIVLSFLAFYALQIYTDGQKEKISNRYNSIIINYKNKGDSNTSLLMKEIVEERDSTYSPLALYFLIDNNLIKDRQEINGLFDILVNKVDLDQEIKNLIIYKKALYNSDFVGENELIEMLNPIINSSSVWKSHALYLIAEYFYSKDEKQKSKEFFSLIIDEKNANQDILVEAQKRLSRDLSE
tara:strand:+ start:1924 stop:2568 length:645 start_codon:yes stop_codon:yes gene_type:complete